MSHHEGGTTRLEHLDAIENAVRDRLSSNFVAFGIAKEMGGNQWQSDYVLSYAFQNEYPGLFEKLGRFTEADGILSWDLSQSSLEDVFEKVLQEQTLPQAGLEP